MDFNILVEKANQQQTDEAFVQLVSEVQRLEEMFLLMSPGNKEVPFFGEEDNKNWMYVYTSYPQLEANAPLIFQESVQLHYVKIPTHELLPWLVQHQDHGIFGIRINEGPFGFWISLTDLRNLISETGERVEQLTTTPDKEQ